MSERLTAYIALGSNLGDRRALLDEAIARLRSQSGIEVTSVSSFHETEPVGGPAGQGKYLNAAAELRTTLTPMQLLRVLQDIEQAQGRVRTEKWGPRTIDLDLLLYGDQILRSDQLTLPHPHMHERLFVLEPLIEIAPHVVHPMLLTTAKDLHDRLKQPVPTQRELEGQSAVVVGSTKGIGRAIALALASAGANVLIHGRSSRESAIRVVMECGSNGTKADCRLADLRDETACLRFVDDAWKWAPNIDIWIQCAGADTLTGDAAQWPFERKLEELWAVDVRATMLMTRAVGARMKRQGHGVILTMGWDQAETGMEGDSGQLFAAAKGAVMAFSKSLSLELAPEVRVNCLAPGWIKTAWGEQASEKWQQRVLAETPLYRWGTPEDVAAAARWLVSPAAQFITGQIIRINGGAIRS